MLQPYEIYPETYDKLLKLIRKLAKTTNKLPSEEALAQQLGVSRVKIRDVLGQLESMGYVIRKRGVGTRINLPMLDEIARVDVDCVYVDVIEELGYSSRADVRGVKCLDKANDAVTRGLRLEPGEKVYRIEKLIYADEQPAVQVIDYFPARYYDKADTDLSMLAQHTFYLLQNMSPDLLETLIVHMDACNVEKKTADVMRVPEGTALLKLDSVCYTRTLDAVMYCVEYFNTKILPLSFQKRILCSKFKQDV